jgi:2',3'-cyclic-nucleotide 2'-phosphodiesterase (5'-nucleotidase family)
MNRILTILITLVCVSACSAPNEFVITVVGTNDVHGELLPRDGEGGLVAISAYVNAVRAARDEDGGAVILLDAGDMWQGTLESNYSEGAALVEAFNSLGYAAAAVGNHEFDFGPAGPLPIPRSPEDDPRGALKPRASEANFPFLAANLIDETTGQPVKWPNVYPSTLIDVQGVQVGIIGVMTKTALARAIASNTVGLTVAPLAETIEREALVLREAGATIILVSAHAGGKCTEFDDPNDTSSCVAESENFSVANSLPHGLVDHILAGHTHQGIAHVVNGIAISEGYSRATAFSRVDLTVDRRTGKPTSRKIFPPKQTTQEPSYEGQEFAPAVDMLAIADKAKSLAADIKREKIGIHLETAFELSENPESALGNLYTDALLASVEADISMHRSNTMIRANLPAGDLTMGSLYEMSPFDNQITVIKLSGAELRRVIAAQAHYDRFRIGFSGMRVTVACADKRQSVVMRLANGREIADSDSVSIAVADYLALGGDDVFTAVMPDGGYERQLDAPLARDFIVDWLRERGGSISVSDFSSEDDPKWTLPEDLDPECRLPN